MLIETIAEKISEWFPELGGRSVAVMDAEITKNNVPTLPICMVSPIRESAILNGNGATVQIVPEIIIEFWMTPQKLKRDDGTESAYWASYDYEDLRNRLVYHLGSGEIEGVITNYLGLTFETTSLAQILAFRFSFRQGFCYKVNREENCKPDLNLDGQPRTFVARTCPKAILCKE